MLQGINQVGLTFRGLYGEGSEVVGNFFQISNQTTLGKTEEDLIDHLQKIVQQVIQYEKQARAILLRDAPNVIEDKVWRAYGLLRYAHVHFLRGSDEPSERRAARRGAETSPGTQCIHAQPNHDLHPVRAPGADCRHGVRRSEDSDSYRAAYIRDILAREGSSTSEAPPRE